MCFHVSFEVALQGETLSTKSAFMGLVPRVEQEVVLQVRLFAEASVTDVTLVRPGPVVDVHVRLEVSGSRERLGAQGTLMGLLLENKTKIIGQ